MTRNESEVARDDLYSEYLTAWECGREGPIPLAELPNDLRAELLELKQFWDESRLYLSLGGQAGPIQVSPGRIGRYRIEGVVGRGGNGIVLRAYDPPLERTVALKIPRLDSLLTDDRREQFFHEARVAATAAHANVAAVYDVSESGPIAYLASEFIGGGSLADWIHRHRPGPRDAVRIARDVAHGVSHCHELGILHRDLKPSNILLSFPPNQTSPPSLDEATPKVSDFGLARLMDTRATISTRIAGSPPYMAPELIDRSFGPVGPTADVYGIGAILYESLTGRPPFSGESSVAVIASVIKDPVPSPRQWNPDTPRDVEVICRKCLEKRPTHRYQTVREVAEELDRVLQDRPIRARPRGTPSRVIGWMSRHKSQTAGIAATGVTFAAMIALAFLPLRNPEQTGDTPTLAPTDVTLRRSAYDLGIRKAAAHFAANEYVELRQSLDSLVPRAGEPDYRGLSWNYLRGRQFPVRQTARVPEGVYRIAWEAGGKWFATIGNNGVVRIWDAETCEERKRLQFVNEQNIFSRYHRLTISNDATRICAAVIDERQRITHLFEWHVPDGTLARHVSFSVPINPHQFDVVYADDSILLAYNNDELKMSEWSRNGRFHHRTLVDGTGYEPTQLQVTRGNVFVSYQRCALIDGIRTATDNFIRLVDKSGSMTEKFPISPSFPVGRGFAFSASHMTACFDELVTNVADNRILLKDVASNVTLWKTRHPVAGERIVVISGRGHYCAVYSSEIGNGSLDVSYCLLNSKDGTIVHTNQGTKWGVQAVSFSPDESWIATAGTDGICRIWPCATKPGEGGHPPEREDSQAWPVVYSRNGDWAFTGHDSGVITQREAVSGEIVSRIPASGVLITSLATSPGERRLLAAGDYDGHVYLVETGSGRTRRTWKAHERACGGMAFSPDGRSLVTCGRDRAIRVWDPETGSLRGEYRCHNDNVRAVTYLRDDTVVSASEDGTLQSWETRKKRLKWTHTLDSEVWCLAESSLDGGILVCGTRLGHLHFWKRDSGQLLGKSNHGHEGGCNALAVSPDGQSVVSVGMDRMVRVWDVRTMTEQLALPGHAAQINGVAVSPNGTSFATSDHAGETKIWPILPRTR